MSGSLPVAEELQPYSKEDIEVYLSEDILQGEQVPFYITWKDVPVKTIELAVNGFDQITKLYNTNKDHVPSTKLKVDVSELRAPRYLGGVLRTTIYGEPFRSGELSVVISLADGKSKSITRSRTLHSARLFHPAGLEIITLPLPPKFIPTTVEIQGRAMVILDIEESSTSNIPIVLPAEIMSAFEKFGAAVVAGIDRLKEEFPEYTALLDGLFKIDKMQSIRQFSEETEAKLMAVRTDKSFMEALSFVFVSAFLGQTSIRDTLFIPMLEYLESTATTRVFFISPFVSAKVPAGGGRFSFQIEGRDVLGRLCGEPIEIQFDLKSEREMLIPVKDLVQFRRQE